MTPDRYTQVRAHAGTAVDAGLRAHLGRVYNRMALGVLLTAVTAYVVGSSPALLALFLGGPQMYIVMLAPLAIVWFGFRPETMSSGKLRISFIALSVLYGISFSAIAAVAGQDAAFAADVARAFFIATGMFAGLSIFGYTTKKDLTGLGSFAVMGVIGVLLLTLVNLGLGAFTEMDTTGFANMISVIGILAFAALTAWQTQAMKEMYHPSAGDEANSRMAWSAALTLYISFIAMFQYILSLLQNR
ncbi:MAG: Bax inhibitor-1/YccA family protein [Alphaproteobacteria bacterium]|nr:Bax inhibitor-1/YccA family protein [Alphaproteobacteria bacterium]